jgi:hypothetical protein
MSSSRRCLAGNINPHLHLCLSPARLQHPHDIVHDLLHAADCCSFPTRCIWANVVEKWHIPHGPSEDFQARPSRIGISCIFALPPPRVLSISLSLTRQHYLSHLLVRHPFVPSFTFQFINFQFLWVIRPQRRLYHSRFDRCDPYSMSFLQVRQAPDKRLHPVLRHMVEGKWK